MPIHFIPHAFILSAFIYQDYHQKFQMQKKSNSGFENISKAVNFILKNNIQAQLWL